MTGFEAFWWAIWFVITFLFAAALFLVCVLVLALVGFEIALVFMTRGQREEVLAWLERQHAWLDRNQ
jgi:hypothetical protein